MTHASSSWKEISGKICGLFHVLPVRVYYEDTDYSGVVYHANYVRFAERGRSAFFHTLNVSHQHLLKLDEPLAFTISAMTMNFFSPAVIDDLLEVRTGFSQAQGARLQLYQVISKGQQVLWHARVKAACINLQGRPRRLPKQMKEALTCHIHPIDELEQWAKNMSSSNTR